MPGRLQLLDKTEVIRERGCRYEKLETIDDRRGSRATARIDSLRRRTQVAGLPCRVSHHRPLKTVAFPIHTLLCVPGAERHSESGRNYWTAIHTAAKTSRSLRSFMVSMLGAELPVCTNVYPRVPESALRSPRRISARRNPLHH